MSVSYASPGVSLSSIGSEATSPSTIHSFGMEQLRTVKSGLNISALFQDAPRGSPRRYGRYYFDDGNVTFLVEDMLYNVHRYFFQRDSSSFASIFSLGLKDDEPLPLTGVTVGDFDIFLSILYPTDFGIYAATTVEDWTSILHLASKWNFQSIKVLAIRHLDPIASPIDKVVLGRRYGIDEWLPDAYSAICGRREPLTLEEGVRLGMEDVINIAAVRQGESSPDFMPTIGLDALRRTFKLPDVAVDVGLQTDAITQTGDSVEPGKSESLLESPQVEGMLGGQDGQRYKGENVTDCRRICETCGLERVCNFWPFCSRVGHGGGTCACATENEDKERNHDGSGTSHRDYDCTCILCRRATVVHLPLKDRKKKKGKR